MTIEQIISGAIDLEDGETGINKCIDWFCKENSICQDLADKAKHEAFKQGAIEAGIPLLVIEGKTKLTDHFSKEYINFKSKL
jgi:hypothetical protein